MDSQCTETLGEAAAVPCPKGGTGPHAKECSGHGTCDAGECICEEKYDGSSCEKFQCQLTEDCFHGGSCNLNTTQCDCLVGFTGVQCNSTIGGTNGGGTNDTRARLSPRFATTRTERQEKEHMEIVCVDEQGQEKRMNAEMVVKNDVDGPAYSLCEFFCGDGDIGKKNKKFQGACQINGRKFTPGGNVALFFFFFFTHTPLHHSNAHALSGERFVWMWC